MLLQFKTDLFDRFLQYLWIHRHGVKYSCHPSQSVSNLVESGLGRIVYFTALQQIVFNTGRVIIERVVRDPNRSTQTSSSSQDLTSFLDKYVPEWMGKDALDGLCSHPPWATTDVCFDLPVTASGLNVESDDFSRSAKVQKLPASRSSSELSAHQMAPSGVIAHKRGRRALEPMEIISSRPTATSLYSPWGWRLRPSSTMLDFFVVPLSFALSRSSLDSLFFHL